MDIRVVILLILEGLFALWLLRRSHCLVDVRVTLRCALLLVLALFIRLAFFDRENTDYQWFLKVWVDFYRTNPGFSALGKAIGNYNIPYLYFLALFARSSIRDLYLIKLLSVFFDILLAWAGLLLVRRCGGSILRGLVCFFVILFLPTVVLNSALWGQCDSIYTSLALLGIAAALPTGRKEGNPALSMVCIALSFGFKLQAVFIMPVWVILWAWQRYKWYWFGLFPLTYLVLILPAVIAGRPLQDAVMLYFNQAGTVGDALNYNAPSLTAFLRNVTAPEALSSGLIIAAFVAMGMIVLSGILLRRRMTPVLFLGFTALTVLVIPFLLPHMHDRYFYPADVVTAVLAVCVPWLTPAAVFTQFGSFICYIAYFTGFYQRVGRSNFFLTNDRGAFTVLLAMAEVTFFLCRETFFAHPSPLPAHPRAALSEKRKK